MPRGAEDRQAAFDSQPRVEGLPGDLAAAGNGDFDAQGTRRHLSNGRSDHPPRDGIDGRLARRDLQPRLGDHAHAFAGGKGHIVCHWLRQCFLIASCRPPPLPRFAPAHRGHDLQPVGAVWVVAGILADGGRGSRLAEQSAVKDRDSQRSATGEVQSTSVGIWPLASAMAAALAAAAAQVPVVMPVRRLISVLPRDSATHCRICCRASSTLSGKRSDRQMAVAEPFPETVAPPRGSRRPASAAEVASERISRGGPSRSTRPLREHIDPLRPTPAADRPNASRGSG